MARLQQSRSGKRPPKSETISRKEYEGICNIMRTSTRFPLYKQELNFRNAKPKPASEK